MVFEVGYPKESVVPRSGMRGSTVYERKLQYLNSQQRYSFQQQSPVGEWVAGECWQDRRREWDADQQYHPVAQSLDHTLL